MILEIGCGKYRSDSDVAIDVRRDTMLDVLSDAQMLPFKRNIFELVYMFEVLEHVKSPFQVLNEINQILKNNGKLVISVPNIYYFRHLIRWIGTGRFSSVCKEHISAWSLSELTNLLTLTGFKIISVKFTDYPRHNKPSKLAKLMPRLTKHSLRIVVQKKE